MRYAKRTDGNQSKIIDDLKKLRYEYKDTSKIGWGFPDILVRDRKKGVGVEIKVKGKSKQLTGAEIEMRDWLVSCGFNYIVAENVEQIIAEFERKK